MGVEVPLHELLLDVGVGVAKGAKVEPPADDEWGLLRLGALTSGEFTASQAKRLMTWDPAYPRLEVRAGDVLMVRVNGAQALVGASCVAKNVRPRLVLSDLMYRLVPDPERLNADFLGLMLASDKVRRQIRRGMRGTSGQFQLPQAEVKKLQIPLFPLSEQRDIVAVNEAFERRIGDLERVAQKRSTLLSAAVSALLRSQDSAGKTLETTMISCDPGITLGSHRAPQKRATGYLRVANVRMGWIDTSDVASLESTSSDRPRYELEAGDVLVVEGHANPEQIGRAALVGPAEEGLLYQNHLFRLRFDRDEVVPEFAMLWLNSEAVRSYWISRCATSSGLYTINSKLLADAPFPVVPIEEQRKIVETWRTGIRAVDSSQGQIAKLRTIQQGVIEDLLSGRTRVNRT
ncbi:MULTISPECIES: hypothetical protein [Streptomyces]|uniref:Type I restriction modification DNA specificity domain-containing protein n=1 Tax=Streptomyces pseudogriseolus TaxID=36817 RepID=A0ABQ2TJ48_STREZ|nr:MULTISPECIES: hypothetical protein [Streptomyces]GGS69783.1 hypothetical protein GCM10010285_56000 [Streptomyces rubiginosus]